VRLVDGVNTDGRLAFVLDRFKALGSTEIDVGEARRSCVSQAEVRPFNCAE
jgi:hypothetical protein